MNTALQSSVEGLIASTTGAAARVTSSRAASGGCINDARVLDLDDGRRFFMKSNPAPLPGRFEREADGLIALAAARSIRVPHALGTGGGVETGDVIPFIVMEAIDAGRPGPDFFERFGREFANLHRATNPGTQRYGFDADNYLGATLQPNSWSSDWCAFWRDHRLGHQFRLARSLGHADAEFSRLGDRLLNRLDTELAEPDEPPCLLHGDLWSGNFMTDERGAPVLVDPAAYYGRREADIAMTKLFGGFDSSFYRAYEEVWPLADGSARRIEIYTLYHVLNHLNLFGASYYAQALTDDAQLGLTSSLAIPPRADQPCFPVSCEHFEF